MEQKTNSAFIKAEKASGERVETTENSNRAEQIQQTRIKTLKTEERAKRIADRRLNRQRKRQNKAQKRNSDRTVKNKGWLAAVISLGVCSLVLLTVLTIILITPSSEGVALESSYRKAFYDTVDQVDNIDLNLSKVLASKDTKSMQVYLTDLAINSELCENDISELPLKDENKFYTAKLVNQIGDFAKYLNKKLIDGEPISQDDYQTLKSLYAYNLQLKNALGDMQNEMGGDFSFKEVSSGKKGSPVIKGFEQLQNMSIQYPELIYDGPFSDGLDNREVKGLKGASITQAEATDIFKQVFAKHKLEMVKAQGEVNSLIPCYAVSGERDGEVLYAQFTKTGGDLLMFAYSGSCKKVDFSEDYATEKALEFLESVGYTNLKPVWINLANNVYTINFAYEQDGIIVYSDLIKVRVCAETSMVIGLEASLYIINHTARTIEGAKISSTVAKSKLFNDMEVATTRLCLVPIGNSSEKLCYEFNCDFNGSTYYVYIDAINGRQVEMFKVIESTEGKLLL